MRGVVYVAVGRNALQEANASIDTLVKHNNLPYEVIEGVAGTPRFKTPDKLAHWLKVSMYSLTPFEPTLMLDADTRVKGDISVGFDILDAGWDMVMVPSVPPMKDASLWSLPANDKQYTERMLTEVQGYIQHIMLNTGLLYFRNNDRTACFFEEWAHQWLLFRDRDQGAFLRALKHNPVRLWLLGYPFNSLGGKVVDHLFGRAR